jgi:hypothetical protein
VLHSFDDANTAADSTQLSGVVGDARACTQLNFTRHRLLPLAPKATTIATKVRLLRPLSSSFALPRLHRIE